MNGLDLIADDPTPTTGGPVDYEFADGCRCYIREDVEYGDVLTRPPGGCPVHTPPDDLLTFAVGWCPPDGVDHD